MVLCMTKPTRVTDQLKTTIDQFITNNTSLQIKLGVFQIDITHRYRVFYIITCDFLPSSQSKQNYFNIDYKKINLAVYEKDIQTVVACTLDFISLNSQINLNIIFDKFINQFRIVMEKRAPFKSIA